MAARPWKKIKSVEARLLREDFQRFWERVNPKRAAKFLDS